MAHFVFDLRIALDNDDNDNECWQTNWIGPNMNFTCVRGHTWIPVPQRIFARYFPISLNIHFSTVNLLWFRPEFRILSFLECDPLHISFCMRVCMCLNSYFSLPSLHVCVCMCLREYFVSFSCLPLCFMALITHYFFFLRLYRTDQCNCVRTSSLFKYMQLCCGVLFSLPHSMLFHKNYYVYFLFFFSPPLAYGAFT